MSARLLALLVSMLVALAGCGGGDDDDGGSAGGASTATVAAAPPPPPADEPAADGVTDDAFIAAFKKVSGFTLEPIESSTWTVMNPSTEEVVASAKKYGIFSVNVMSAVPESLDILLLDDAGKKATADADGVYFRQDDKGNWSAATVVEPNVYVSWQAGPRKATTALWDRLLRDVKASVAQAG